MPDGLRIGIERFADTGHGDGLKQRRLRTGLGLRVRIYRTDLRSGTSVIDQTAHCFRRKSLAARRWRYLAANLNYSVLIRRLLETAATDQHSMSRINEQVKPPPGGRPRWFFLQQRKRVPIGFRIRRPRWRNCHAQQVTERIRISANRREVRRLHCHQTQTWGMYQHVARSMFLFSVTAEDISGYLP
jgi:hypothetical protein